MGNADSVTGIKSWVELLATRKDLGDTLKTYEGVDTARLGASFLGITGVEDPSFVGICNKLGIKPGNDYLRLAGQQAIIFNTLHGITNPLAPTESEKQI